MRKKTCVIVRDGKYYLSEDTIISLIKQMKKDIATLTKITTEEAIAEGDCDVRAVRRMAKEHIKDSDAIFKDIIFTFKGLFKSIKESDPNE